MSDISTRCLESFPNWLASLSADAAAFVEVLSDPSSDASVRRTAAGALAYLLKSLDLIPDGVADLGFVDDAFVLRLGAAQLLAQASASAPAGPALEALAADAALIEEFLDADFKRLHAYVATLPASSARGYNLEEVVSDDAVRQKFCDAIAAWADSYQAPTFKRDQKTLVKLRAFLGAKLPALH